MQGGDEWLNYHWIGSFNSDGVYASPEMRRLQKTTLFHERMGRKISAASSGTSRSVGCSKQEENAGTGEKPPAAYILKH